jgi:hypothetical protein
MRHVRRRTVGGSRNRLEDTIVSTTQRLPVPADEAPTQDMHIRAGQKANCP